MSSPQLQTSDLEARNSTIRFGTFELDSLRFELRQSGRVVPIEPRTFDLLELLARNIGRTVTRDEIFSTVWQNRVVSDAALSSQVRSARRVLGDNGKAQQMIVTVHGRGFRLRRKAAGDFSDVAAEPVQQGAERPTNAAQRIGLPTLVVMPCHNVDGDGRGTILAQGITDDIITALSKCRWLRVIPRTTAYAVQAAMTDPYEIARKVGADYILIGSVRRDGTQVRITAQAAETETTRCLWSESFDRDMTGIFKLQDDISRLVSARIATELGITEQRRAARQPRQNQGVWELYQSGTMEFYRFSAEGNRRCQRLMRQAIANDAGLAQPYARLAYAMILEMIYFDGEPDKARMNEALEIALRGVACDNQDATTFFSLARVRLARCEYEAAIDALEESLRLNPWLALSHCGLADSLTYEGRIDEAIGKFQTAIDLSPNDPFRWAFMSYRALAHLFNEDFYEAASWAHRASLVPNAHYWASANLASALGHLGERRRGNRAIKSLLQQCPGFSLEFAQKRLFYVKDRAQIELFLEGLRRAGVSNAH